MPVPPNISPATAINLMVDVPHTTVAADINLAPNGTGFTTNCVINNPQKNALWYKHTIPAGVKYISFGIKGIPDQYPPLGYVPCGNLWKETTPGVYAQYKVQSNQYCYNMQSNGNNLNSFLVLGDPGTTYFFQIQNNGTGVAEHDLTVMVRHAPVGVGKAGDIWVPDDVGPFPGAVVDNPSGEFKGYIGYGNNWSSEDFSVIQRGGWTMNGLHDNLHPLKGKAFRCFNGPPNFELISIVDCSAWASSNGSINDCVSDQVGTHYGSTWVTGADYLHKIDAKTGIKEVTHLIPGRLGQMIGIHAASGVFYYSDYDNYSTIHRMNVNTGAALPDFLPDSGKYVAGGFVKLDGTVIIITEDDETVWDVYPPGSIARSSLSFVRPYHRASFDNTLDGVLIWSYQSKIKFEFSWFTTLETIEYTIEGKCPVIFTSGGPVVGDDVFGYSDSCPALMFPLAEGEYLESPNTELSGIYAVDITETQRHDSYYGTDPAVYEKNIPTPVIRTALIGE